MAFQILNATHVKRRDVVAADMEQCGVTEGRAENHAAGLSSDEVSDQSLISAADHMCPGSPEDIHRRSRNSSVCTVVPRECLSSAGSSPVIIPNFLEFTNPPSLSSFNMLPSFLTTTYLPSYIEPLRGGNKDTMSPDFNINSVPPFIDPMTTVGVQPYDVLKIKNVPFAVTIPEIKHFVGRLTSSPLIKEHVQGFPVHIIMERPTGKTMDCYVEFQQHGAAKAAVQRAEQSVFDGRTLKIGARHIEVEVSSEGELCAALFPRAKSTKWDPVTGVPTIVHNADPFSEGFQGFYTIEEMDSVVRQASNPQKSSFNARCQQRVYESMISTLYKFPWQVPEHYSVNSRNFLWSKFKDMLQQLMIRVNPDHDDQLWGSPTKEVGLNHTLLWDFLMAGLNAHMFSMRQRFMIAIWAGSLGPIAGVPEYAHPWPFQCLLHPPNFDAEVMKEWLKVLEIGFKKVLVRRLPYRYESSVKLFIDETHGMMMHLTDDARTLTFRELITMEKYLMKLFVNLGREEWCKLYRVPFMHTDMLHDNFTNNQGHNLELAMNSLRLADTKDVEDKDEDEDELGPPVPNEPGGFYGSEAFAPPEPQATYFVASSHFNPNTPEFVPGGTLTDTSDGTRAKTTSASDAPMHPRAAYINSLIPPLPPSWIRPETEASSRPYDPFTSDVSPQGRRRLSLQSANSVSKSSDHSTPVTGNVGGDGDINPECLDYWAGAQPKIPGTHRGWGSWGPGVRTITVGKKRSLGSGASGNVTVNSAATDNSNNNNAAQTTPTSSRPTFAGSPMTQGPARVAFGSGSPVRGNRRSSASRNAVYIQPTIDEEGDASTTETVDGTDDVGGVSI